MKAAEMGSFVFKRLLQAIPVLIGITLIAFALLNQARGAALAQLGETAPEEKVAMERSRLGLDLPFLTRYRIYMVGGRYSDGTEAQGLLRGDMGRTAARGEPVSRLVWNAFGVTLPLALGALAVAVTLGVTAGIVSALKPYGFWDMASMLAAFIGVSMPVFWLGQLMQRLFAARLGWVPVAATSTASVTAYLLPCLALGLVVTAVVARLTRSAMLDATGQEFVRTARAKGLTRTQAVLRHAFANAATPVMTVIGNNLGGLLAGAVLTESVFGLPGLGRLIVDSISAREFNLLTGALAASSLIFVAVNLAVDMAYALLDPRIRYV
jgi:peptide/nickel transport system permease protein